MRQAILSKQTPADRFFAYNPFTDAEIRLYTPKRGPRDPYRFILEPVHPFDHKNFGEYLAQTPPAADMDEGRGFKLATTFNERVVVIMDPARNIHVFVNGKKTERYNIVYKNKRKKKPFASF